MPNEDFAPAATDELIGQVLPLSDPDEGSFALTEARREQLRNASLELDHLRKLLSAQDAAKLHAQSVAAQLQRELKSFETDNNRLRADLKKLQDQATLTKLEHNTELYQASERESLLKKELQELRAQLDHVVAKTSGHGKRWLVIGLGVVIPALIWAAATQWHSRAAPASDDDSTPDSAVVADSARPVAAKPAAKDLSGAMVRLEQALDSFKGEKPEQVLQRIHIANAVKGVEVCSFEWNNGQVSMLFGSKEGLDIDKAMSRCADAVEKAAK